MNKIFIKEEEKKENKRKEKAYAAHFL